MAFQIVRNDITRVKADAIVNTANPKPIIGGGTDRAIYEAAGKKQLLAERKKIGQIAMLVIQPFVMEHSIKVILVVFDKKTFQEKLFEFDCPVLEKIKLIKSL